MVQKTVLIQLSGDDLETAIDRGCEKAIKKYRPVISDELPTPAQEPISPEELCKRLEISKPTAWAWERKNIIKGYHLGNRKYFIWQEILLALTKKGEGIQ